MSMDAEHKSPDFRIEVAYATPEKQVILAVFVAPGTTVADGIELSAIRDEFPDLEFDSRASRHFQPQSSHGSCVTGWRPD